MPPFVLFPPRSRIALMRGVDTLANVIGVTLGPVGRTVAITHISSPHSTPEMLPDGGTIARRMIDLPRPAQDMGAMLVRQLACRMQDEVGDGTATAVVIAQAALRESARYVVAGWNANRLRAGMDAALEASLAELRAMAEPINTPAAVRGMIEAAVGHPGLAKIIAEAVDVVGTDGIIAVEESQGTSIDREYTEGVRWEGGYTSAYFATNEERGEAALVDAPILLTDADISSAAELLPIVERAAAGGENSLVIIAKDIRDQALAFLVVNKQQGRLRPLAIKAPLLGDNQRAVLEDIAILTGGRLVSDVVGRRLQDATLEDLGRARRVWANNKFFSIIGGKGRPAAVRQRIREMRAAIPGVESNYDRERMRERISKLRGGTASLRIGAHSASEQTELRQRAEATVKAVQAAVEEGIVPGGGAAYLACIAAVRRLSLPADLTAGAKVVARALEEPTRRIVANAGGEPDPTIARLRERPPGWGYDVLGQRMTDMRAAGIVDALKVARWALAAGISAAGVALTTDVLVHRKNPPLAKAP